MTTIIRATTKPILVTFIFSIIYFTVKAQTPGDIYVPFYSYLQQNIRYPFAARNNGTTGRMMVTFTVHDNNADSIKIRKTIGYNTDEEVTRALQKYKPLPNMLPGTYALNVFFALAGKDDLATNTPIDADHANALKDIAALNQTSASRIIGLDEVVIVAFSSR